MSQSKPNPIQFRDYGISIAGILLIWQGIVWITQVPAFILPGPWQVLESFVTHLDLIAEHTWVTAIEVVVGLCIGTVLGIATALFLAISARARRLLMPALVISQIIPVFALAPILTLWLGYGLLSKIAMTILIIYFPVTSNFLDGLRRTPSGYLDLANCLGSNRINTLMQVCVPAALPSLASGIRLAAVYAPIGAVIGEWVGASSGLGYLMLLANGRVKIDLMFAALIALCLFTILLRGLITMLGNKIDMWSGVSE